VSPSFSTNFSRSPFKRSKDLSYFYSSPIGLSLDSDLTDIGRHTVLPRFSGNVYNSLGFSLPPDGSTQQQISICKACEEHWQSISKSGHRADFHMPGFFSSCATVRTRGCRVEEVISHPMPCFLPPVVFSSLTSYIRVQNAARL
jgi:hypothetical protein